MIGIVWRCGPGPNAEPDDYIGEELWDEPLVCDDQTFTTEIYGYGRIEEGYGEGDGYARDGEGWGLGTGPWVPALPAVAVYLAQAVGAIPKDLAPVMRLKACEVEA